MFDTGLNWLYKVPCIASVVLNLVFLLRIVHVLVSKLHVSSDVNEYSAMVKTARAIGKRCFTADGILVEREGIFQMRKYSICSGISLKQYTVLLRFL